MTSLKSVCLFLGSIVFCLPNFGQTWTWVNGSAVTSATNNNVAAAHGTLGVSTATNHPGYRTLQASWKDASGNMWLFGGNTMFGSSTGLGNDLWKYNPSTNLWTWIKGSNLANQLGVYGTQGLSAPGNNPGARTGGATWVDNSGNFWLMGGFGYNSASLAYMNDLWKYDPSTNEWTWIKGSSNGVQSGFYGTLGVATASNFPGARTYAQCWTDIGGNLFLFGGAGYGGAFSFGYLNDLWKYSPSTNQWAWIGGTSSLSQYGIYGTQGVASSTNMPGSRFSALKWSDASGNIYLYGGTGCGSGPGSGSGSLNDLWKYSTSTNQWTWLRGSTSGTTMPVYGSLGVSTASNDPGGRTLGLTWGDASGNLWFYGGKIVTTDVYGDLWKYSVSSNEWVWIGGSNSSTPVVNYGTLGVASPTNSPGPRYGSSAWVDNAGGSLWLYSGQSYNALGSSLSNDVWKYEICSVANTPLNTTSPGNQNTCSGNTVTLSASSDAQVSWYPTATLGSSIAAGQVYTTTVLSAGIYTYYAQGNLCLPSASRAAITVTVNPSPTITASSGSICSGSSFSLNPQGANVYTIVEQSLNLATQVVTPTITTSYSISGTSSAGCTGINVANAVVTVVALPVVSVSGQFSICNGFSTSLSASGAGSYTWSTNAVTPVLNINPVNTITYSVVGENSSMCTNTAQVTVTVYPLPQISAGSGNVCYGNTFTIQPSGAATYIYSSGSSTVAPVVNTSYTVSGSSAQGCLSSNSAVVTVTVLPLPTFTISGNNYVCLGSSVSQLVNGAIVNAQWNNGLNGNFITVSPTLNTVYSVTVTGTNGCQKSASKMIQVYPLPSLTVAASSFSVCQGDFVILKGIGANTYTWSGNVTDNTPFIPSLTSTYTVTGSDTNSCYNKATVTVTVHTLPVIQLSTSSSSLCSGETFSLQASGGATYTWSSGQSGPTVVFNPLITSIYTVTGTDSIGCKNTATVLAIVDACTGLVEQEKKFDANFRVYPNPSSNRVTLELDNARENLVVLIYNSIGQLVFKSPLSTSKMELIISDYPSGFYTCMLREGGALRAQVKLVKQ